MNMIVFDNEGKIIARTHEQDLNVLYKKYPQEFRENLSSILIENPPKDVFDYKVVERELIKIPEEELFPTLAPTEKQIEQQAVQSFVKMSFGVMAPTLQPTQILEFEPLVEDWVLGVYTIGDIRKHLGQVWKCVQGHNNTNNPDIEPGKSAAQWSPYHSKDIKYAKPYIQPQGSHDSYMKDEYCIFEAKTYKSKIDNNVWTPIGYPQGWEMII